MLGRRRAVLLDGVRPAGRHPLTLDLATLASGVYVARVVTAAGTRQRHFVVVR